MARKKETARKKKQKSKQPSNVAVPPTEAVTRDGPAVPIHAKNFSGNTQSSLTSKARNETAVVANANINNQDQLDQSRSDNAAAPFRKGPAEALRSVIGCTVLGLFCKACQTPVNQSRPENVEIHLKRKHGQKRPMKRKKLAIVLGQMRAECAKQPIEDILIEGDLLEGLQCPRCEVCFPPGTDMTVEKHKSESGNICQSLQELRPVYFRKTICGRFHLMSSASPNQRQTNIETPIIDAAATSTGESSRVGEASTSKDCSGAPSTPGQVPLTSARIFFSCIDLAPVSGRLRSCKIIASSGNGQNAQTRYGPLLDLIGCTPFGLYCKECGISLISHALATKHYKRCHPQIHEEMASEDISQVIIVLESQRAKLPIEDFYLKGPILDGSMCSVCQQPLTTDDMRKRHFRKVRCKEGTLKNMKYRRTICGRVHHLSVSPKPQRASKSSASSTRQEAYLSYGSPTSQDINISSAVTRASIKQEKVQALRIREAAKASAKEKAAQLFEAYVPQQRDPLTETISATSEGITMLESMVGCTILGFYCKLCQGILSDKALNVIKHLKRSHPDMQIDSKMPSEQIVSALSTLKCESRDVPVDDILVGDILEGTQCAKCQRWWPREKLMTVKKHKRKFRDCADICSLYPVYYQRTSCFRNYVVSEPYIERQTAATTSNVSISDDRIMVPLQNENSQSFLNTDPRSGTPSATIDKSKVPFAVEGKEDAPADTSSNKNHAKKDGPIVWGRNQTQEVIFFTKPDENRNPAISQTSRKHLVCSSSVEIDKDRASHFPAEQAGSVTKDLSNPDSSATTDNVDITSSPAKKKARFTVHEPAAAADREDIQQILMTSDPNELAGLPAGLPFGFLDIELRAFRC